MTEAQPAPIQADSPLPLFYNKPQPLEPGRHVNAGLSPKNDFSFTRTTNSVAVTASEFSSAAFNYPIVFSMTKPVVPFAVLGMRDNENLFVSADGRWRERCVHSCVRAPLSVHLFRDSEYGSAGVVRR